MRIIGAVALAHLINDLIQSVLPSIYPMLKDSYGLTFTQVGLITLTFQLTASLLQPWVGYYTDRHPKPYLLPMGMICTLVGILMMSQVGSFPLILLAAGLIGIGSSTFHPEASRVARLASGGRFGLAQSTFQVGGNAGSAFGPLLVLVLAIPVIVVLCLLLVALLMTPAMVDLVGKRRFPAMERKQGGSLIVSVLWSLGSTLLALVALVVSMPLWLVPPLVLILPPLIWGWLTYRVFAFDALAVHASAPERKALIREHRGTLLLMGILSGYLGAAPSLIWASGAMLIALAPLLIPVAIWIYTLVFAFASLWFAHFALAALERLRAASAVEVLDALPRGGLERIEPLPDAPDSPPFLPPPTSPGS